MKRRFHGRENHCDQEEGRHHHKKAGDYRRSSAERLRDNVNDSFYTEIDSHSPYLMSLTKMTCEIAIMIISPNARNDP